MAVTLLIGIIAAVCLVSTLIAYVFVRSNENRRKSSLEKQQIRYSYKPSMDIVVRKIKDHDSPSNRASLSSTKSARSSTAVCHQEENELKTSVSRKSTESVNVLLSPQRSTSMAANILHTRRARSPNWRQGSIIDPQQLSLIQFSLPSLNTTDKYRRRSVAICSNIIQSRETPLTLINLPSPCLVAFSLTYLKNSQLKVQFHSFQSLPTNIQFQQITIKVRLTPDGKEKSIQIRKFMEKDVVFENEVALVFSSISAEKLQEKSLQLTLYGKDRAKKTIHLGQVGKIHFNQMKPFEIESRVDFLHEIEKIKPSSVELFISLEKRDEQYLHVDLQRIKGLKVDQKKLDATCYLQTVLLDRHRPLATKQTKFFKLNSTHFNLSEQFDFNIFAHTRNLDRLMLSINLFSNSNHANQYKRIAHLKISSPLFCSGSGTIHWQQFQARDSFSMWHSLNKEQH